jgi:signal transduction histidine kinase
VIRAHYTLSTSKGRGAAGELEDSGIGIAPDEQMKVFEKFKQVGGTLTD